METDEIPPRYDSSITTVGDDSARSQGLTQVAIAVKLNTTRANVNEIEHRARLKMNAADRTVATLQEIYAVAELLIPNEASVFEVDSMTILAPTHSESSY